VVAAEPCIPSGFSDPQRRLVLTDARSGSWRYRSARGRARSPMTGLIPGRLDPRLA
jgi:hypothetical protein